MVNPFKRNAARPLEPEEPGIEMSEGDDDSDWALWEDSVQEFESGLSPLDPFEKVGRRDS